jgi:hypothetical protein
MLIVWAFLQLKMFWRMTGDCEEGAQSLNPGLGKGLLKVEAGKDWAWGELRSQPPIRSGNLGVQGLAGGEGKGARAGE